MNGISGTNLDLADSGIGAVGLLESPGLVADLEALVPGGVHTSVPLANLSRWRVGGVAQLVVCPGSAEEVERVMAYVSRTQVPYIVLGSSSNLLFADEGLKVLGIHIGGNLSGFRIEEDEVWSQAGLWVPAFARRIGAAGLTGAEHTCGIPGTLGGLICMNGGSQRRGIGENLIDVTTVSPEGELRTRTQEECDFRYRHSVFRQSQDIIVSARFRFDKASPATVRRTMLGILGERRRKFPRKMPNCGSVFVSNPAMYADYGPPGAVIEGCGLKGMRVGGAMISPLHANFIVNYDCASARDILTLISIARNTARERTGYDMAAEVCYISPDGKVIPAHIQAEKLCVKGAPAEEA